MPNYYLSNKNITERAAWDCGLSRYGELEETDDERIALAQRILDNPRKVPVNEVRRLCVMLRDALIAAAAAKAEAKRARGGDIVEVVCSSEEASISSAILAPSRMLYLRSIPHRSKTYKPGFGLVAPSSYGDIGSCKARLKGPAQHVEAYRVLCSEINAALQEAFDIGREYGINLLGQLAQGEISVSDFNARTGPE